MADSKWMQRLEGTLGDFAVRSHRRPATALILAGALTLVGAFFTSKLPMIADLERLLPDTFESVKGLVPVKERFGGIGYIVVVGMDAEPAQLKAFADEYAARIEKELPGIRYVDYQRQGGFFEDRQLYYLELPDLEEVARRIKEREKYERRQQNPMLVKLDDEEPPSLDFSDIEAKYGRRSDQRLASGGDYYLDEEKRLVVLLAKPTQIAADLAFSEKLVSDTEKYFAKENLARFGPNFHIGLTGTFKYKVDQQRQLSNDMARATSLAFLLLVLYLLFHFRCTRAVIFYPFSLALGALWYFGFSTVAMAALAAYVLIFLRRSLPVFFVLVPVSVGLAWTYGITYGAFGGINILTGFLGAVLGGLGTEHGIHLIGRYGVLREEGQTSEEATRDAFMHTGGSAIVSSLVAALTFLSISFSEFRAFREFGVIAAVGMLVVITAYILVLPAGLGLAARFGWKPQPIGAGQSELSRWLPKRFRLVAVVMGLVIIGLMYAMPNVRFDYDFRALEDSSLPSFALDVETNRILGYNMEPVVILTESAQSERLLVSALKERRKKGGKDSTIDFVAALDDLVPQQQAEKQQVLASIKKTLDKVSVDSLDAATKPRFMTLMRQVKAEPFTREEIPFSVRRQFEGVKKSAGGFVLIFPNIKLSDGLQVLNFAHEVRGIELPNGERFSAAGEAMILADVLLMVRREARPVLIAATLSVLLAMWLTLGSLRTALLCMLPTALSVLALVGLMSQLDRPFNYLNILLVPVLIGTTVDAGVHLVSRISESHGNFPPVYAETGRAIVGGLITSGVGFAAMLIADHPGLNSMGSLANIGFLLNGVVMVLFFPAVLLWLQKYGLMIAEPTGANSPPAVPSKGHNTS